MRDTDFQEVLLNSTFGNILVFGRLSLTQQLCYAIIPLPYNEKPFFQRYAMYFRVKKHIQLGVSLKAHAQVAYQMDVRVGWTF